MAPSLCSRNVSANVFTSVTSSPNASSRPGPRARVEKSPSRIPPKRLANVCSGNRTLCRTAKPNPSHQRTKKAVSTILVCSEILLTQKSPQAMIVAGRPASNVSTISRCSNVKRFLRGFLGWLIVLPEFGRKNLQFITFEAAVKRASAQAQGFGGFPRVSVETFERLFDQETFDLFNAHLLQAGRFAARWLQT